MRTIAEGILMRFRQEGHRWHREGAKTAVSPNGDTRIALGILTATIDVKAENGTWDPVPAPYETRRELGELLEAWLERHIEKH